MMPALQMRRWTWECLLWTADAKSLHCVPGRESGSHCVTQDKSTLVYKERPSCTVLF